MVEQRKAEIQLTRAAQQPLSGGGILEQCRLSLPDWHFLLLAQEPGQERCGPKAAARC